MAFVTLKKEIAVAEDMVFGIGTVFQDRGAGTMINSSHIPYDENYSIKEIMDFIIEEPAATFVHKVGDTMSGGLNITHLTPTLELQEVAPNGLDDSSGFGFKNFQGFLQGRVQYNTSND